MKTSISHLPEHKQEELTALRDKILEKVPETEMIILYGSYATGKYVEYDQRHEYTYPTFYMSDFDIMVLVSSEKIINSAMRRLYKGAEELNRGKHFTNYTPIQFSAEPITRFCKAVDKRRYFYVDIVQDGIILFDSGKYTIPPLRELNYEEIAELSEEYFEEKYKTGNSFYRHAQYACQDKEYGMASFFLHQATENYLTAIILTSSLYSPKLHRLNTLINDTKKYTMAAVEIFPADTPEEERLFNLLIDAYVQGRYNPNFNITAEDFEILIKRVERLQNVTETFCLEKIEEHKAKIEK